MFFTAHVLRARLTVYHTRSPKMYEEMTMIFPAALQIMYYKLWFGQHFDV